MTMYDFYIGRLGTNVFKVIHCGWDSVVSISHHLRQELKPQYLKCVLTPSSLAFRQWEWLQSAHPTPSCGGHWRHHLCLPTLSDGISGSVPAVGLLPRGMNIFRPEKCPPVSTTNLSNLLERSSLGTKDFLKYEVCSQVIFGMNIWRKNLAAQRREPLAQPGLLKNTWL